MKIVKPPQDLTTRVSAETFDGLKLYLQYQKEVCNTKWDLKEMTAAILGAFLAEGDTDFLAWRKRRPTKHTAAVEANGATDAGAV